jgi:hypothetical protein
MSTITNLQAQIDNAKAEMAQKVVQYLQAQTVPLDNESTWFNNSTWFTVSVAQVLEATGVSAADLLTVLRNDTLNEALRAIDWYVLTTGMGDPEGLTGCWHRRATAGLEGFAFWHRTTFDLSIEDAIALVLAGDEAFESTDDEDDEAYDAYCERLDAAESIVYDYLLNLTTKWTARDIKLARIYIDGLAASHEGTYKAYDFEGWVESLTALNEALLRGLEAAAA